MIYLVLTIWVVSLLAVGYLSFRIGVVNLEPVKVAVVPEVPWKGAAEEHASEIRAMSASVRALLTEVGAAKEKGAPVLGADPTEGPTVRVTFLNDRGMACGSLVMPAKARRVRMTLGGRTYEAGYVVGGEWFYREA